MRLFLTFMFCLFTSLTLAQTDSIGFKVKDGKQYIMHEVQQGEGLFAVGRRYDVHVDKIREANPHLENGLKLGEIILVPYGTVATESKEESPEMIPNVTHQVAPGETLFRISRFYQVSVEDLIRWNNIKDNILSEDQIIYVVPPPEERKIELREEKKPDSPSDRRPERETADRQIEKVPDYGEQEFRRTRSSDVSYKDVVETGMAGWIDDRMIHSDKSLAMHNSARVGSIIQVRNLMNDRIVYVKVVANLPNTPENENVIIKISGTAAERLDVIDNFFRVELKYAEEVKK
jgi:LysM repeat protein